MKQIKIDLNILMNTTNIPMDKKAKDMIMCCFMRRKYN